MRPAPLALALLAVVAAGASASAPERRLVLDIDTDVDVGLPGELHADGPTRRALNHNEAEDRRADAAAAAEAARVTSTLTKVAPVASTVPVAGALVGKRHAARALNHNPAEDARADAAAAAALAAATTSLTQAAPVATILPAAAPILANKRRALNHNAAQDARADAADAAAATSTLSQTAPVQSLIPRQDRGNPPRAQRRSHTFTHQQSAEDDDSIFLDALEPAEKGSAIWPEEDLVLMAALSLDPPTRYGGSGKRRADARA